jgi:antitoxin VapB
VQATTAKFFITGRSQAVRLPAKFRFEGSEAFVGRDPESGDVVLSRKPDSWNGLIELYRKGDVPDFFWCQPSGTGREGIAIPLRVDENARLFARHQHCQPHHQRRQTGHFN